MAVDEIGVGGSGHIGDVGRVHPHLAPVEPVLERLILARQEPGQGLALEIEMAGVDLEAPEDRLRRERAVIGEHDDMLAVIGDRIGTGGVDDDRAVMAFLLLQARMAVIPVGAALHDGELVEVVRSRLDARKRHARHAVHIGRQDQPVPVDRAVLLELIDDVEPHALAFAQPDQRGGDRAVETDCAELAPVDAHRLPGDGQRDVFARHGR